MQGAEIEDEGSVLKYMTKSEIEEQHCSLLIMTQRLFLHSTSMMACVNFGLPSNFISNPGNFISNPGNFFPRHGNFISKAWYFFSRHENLFFRHENYFSRHEKKLNNQLKKIGNLRSNILCFPCLLC